MPLWGLQPDEAEKHSREAMRSRDSRNRDFDLKSAIAHLREAIRLKPAVARYHEQLGRIYLDAPELAIVRGGNLGAHLGKSAELALAEYEQVVRTDPALGMDFGWFVATTRAYLYLGEEKDRIRKKVTEAWVTAFTAAAKKRKPDAKDMAPAVGTIDQLLKDPESFYLRRPLKTVPDPELAVKHLRQAVANRDRGRHKDAEKELKEAKRLAPDLRWLYQTMCHLGR